MGLLCKTVVSRGFSKIMLTPRKGIFVLDMCLFKLDDWIKTVAVIKKLIPGVFSLSENYKDVIYIFEIN